MRKRAHGTWVAFLASTLLILSACRKDAGEPRWDIDVAVPLVRTTLTLGNLVGDTLLSTDGQGNVSLVYSTRLFELGLDTLMAVPDTSFRYRIPEFVIPGLEILAGSLIPAVNDVTRFDLDAFELRTLRVRSGELYVSLTNRLPTSLFTSLTVPGAQLNGLGLSANPVVPPGSVAIPTMVTQNIALDGYEFDLRGPNYNDVNTLALLLNVTTDPNGPNVILNAADSLEAIVSYQNIVPQYARGYFGQRDIDVDADTSELNVFEGLSGLLDIDAVTATLRIRNGVGVDARASIGHIRSVNRSTGNVVDLTHTITSSPLNLDRAIDLGNSFQAATNAYALNTANSNIDLFIENLPDAIAYDIGVQTNPLGDVSNGNDFFYHESTLQADLEVDIPLRLIASDLTLSRQTTVDLAGSLDQHAFQSGTLHFFATNRFPFSAQVTLEIVTTDDELLATLSPGGTIASGQLGFNGLVTSGTTSQLDFAISKDQLDLFYPGSAAGPEGARLRIGAVFNTADQTQHVQLRSDHTIDIIVSLEGNYIVNGDE